MSDDGYPASPYDEYDDEYWDDDPSPDLADDLAQHAAYSPVWQETPQGELDLYHSDWEYYSDDYYDDDPAILKQNTLDGLSLPPSHRHARTQQRGKKRKLDEAREGQIVDTEMRSLIETIQGTVWAQSEAEPIALFRKGEQEKVALLTNWRDLFGMQERTKSKAVRTSTEEDETWANNMSLAAMGLLHQHERRNIQQQDSVQHSETFKDEDEDSVDVDNDFYMSDKESEPSEILHPKSNITPANSTQETSLQDPMLSSETLTELDRDHGRRERFKRRRIQQTLPSPPTSTESSYLKTAEDPNSVSVGTAISTNPPVQRNESDLVASRNAASASTSKGSPRQTTSVKPPNGRKRKLSAEVKDVVDNNGSNKRSRSRQVLSLESNTAQPGKSGDQGSPPRRSQRLKKEAG